MSVPAQVRAVAVAAFSTRRPGAEVLELAYDSYVDGPRSGDPRSSGPADDRRTLVFEDERQVRIEITYEPTLTHLTVHVEPPERVEVQVLMLTPQQRLCVSGMPPVSLSTARRGAVSVAVAADGGESAQTPWQTPWQTSWVPL